MNVVRDKGSGAFLWLTVDKKKETFVKVFYILNVLCSGKYAKAKI